MSEKSLWLLHRSPQLSHSFDIFLFSEPAAVRLSPAALRHSYQFTRICGAAPAANFDACRSCVTVGWATDELVVGVVEWMKRKKGAR